MGLDNFFFLFSTSNVVHMSMIILMPLLLPLLWLLLLMLLLLVGIVLLSKVYCLHSIFIKIVCDGFQHSRIIFILYKMCTLNVL